MTGIHSHRFATQRADEARAFLAARYVALDMVVHSARADSRLRSSGTRVDDTTLDRLGWNMVTTLDVPTGIAAPTIISHTGGGPLTFTVGKQVYTAAAGGSILLPPDVPYAAHWDHTDTRTTMLSPDVLSAAAAASLEPGAELRLAFGAPLSAAADAHWQRVVAMVSDLARSNPEAGPLARRNLTDLLGSAVVACFPNSTSDHADPTAPPRPEPLRRALSYIDDHAHEPIGITEIAAAARLSPRATQAVFRSHLDTTPLSHLRRVRIAHAHAQLAAAVPGDGTTVNGVASAWGFLQPGHFAAFYRSVYGRSPSTTLRS